MTDPRTPRKSARLSTEALLQLVREVAQRMAQVSRDPHVRQEARNVGQAVGRLLNAIRDSGSRPG